MGCVSFSYNQHPLVAPPVTGNAFLLGCACMKPLIASSCTYARPVEKLLAVAHGGPNMVWLVGSVDISASDPVYCSKVRMNLHVNMHAQRTTQAWVLKMTGMPAPLYLMPVYRDIHPAGSLL